MKSTAFRLALISLGILAILSIVFQLGLSIGFRKASHACGWSENYGPLFTADRGPHGVRLPFNMPILPGGNGVFGKVLSISGNTLVIDGRDHVEQGVLVTSSSVIRIGRKDGSFADIRPDMDVSVFGVPREQGQIEARLIRLMDRMGGR